MMALIHAATSCLWCLLQQFHCNWAMLPLSLHERLFSWLLYICSSKNNVQHCQQVAVTSCGGGLHRAAVQQEKEGATMFLSMTCMKGGCNKNINKCDDGINQCHTTLSLVCHSTKVSILSLTLFNQTKSMCSATNELQWWHLAEATSSRAVGVVLLHMKRMLHKKRKHSTMASMACGMGYNKNYQLVLQWHWSMLWLMLLWGD